MTTQAATAMKTSRRAAPQTAPIITAVLFWGRDSRHKKTDTFGLKIHILYKWSFIEFWWITAILFSPRHSIEVELNVQVFLNPVSYYSAYNIRVRSSFRLSQILDHPLHFEQGEKVFGVWSQLRSLRENVKKMSLIHQLCVFRICSYPVRKSKFMKIVGFITFFLRVPPTTCKKYE